jgi:hypothetical protein
MPVQACTRRGFRNNKLDWGEHKTRARATQLLRSVFGLSWPWTLTSSSRISLSWLRRMGACEFGLLVDDNPFGCTAGYNIGQSAP